MGHKKDNEHLREERHLDNLKWEAAKILGRGEGETRDLPNRFQPNTQTEDPRWGRGSPGAVRDFIKTVERAIMQEAENITEANLQDKEDKKERVRRNNGAPR